jgi:hypothetical protein
MLLLVAGCDEGGTDCASDVRCDAGAADGGAPSCGAEGAACDDLDPCTEGDRCSAGVCAGSALVCASPPPSSCVDGTTLRTFAALGTCAAGTCSYAPSDVACEAGCSAGVCACTAQEWTIEPIADDASDKSLAIDSDGVLHAAYVGFDRGSGLGYATRAPTDSAWTLETLEEGYAWSARLVVDAADTIHIVYRHQNGLNDTIAELHHASRTRTGAWEIDTIDASDNGLDAPAIAVDAGGNVHVVYYDETTEVLKYAIREPTASVWTRTTVDSEGDVGSSSAMVVDEAGVVHVVYFDRSFLDLKYAFRATNGAWTTSRVDTAGTVGVWPSLAIDAGGGLHAAYYDATLDDTKYAELPPGSSSWSAMTLDTFADVGVGASVAIDSAGSIHVTFLRRSTDQAVTHAERAASGGPWTFTRIAASTNGLGTTSLAIDRADGLHVLYTRSMFDGYLEYAHRASCPGSGP